MKLIIELNQTDYIKVLSTWASVSRTMNEAKRLLGEFYQVINHEEQGDLEDQVAASIHELKKLEPALNQLHANVRAAIWEQQRLAKQRVDVGAEGNA